jgi:glycosyltransferase involved in cell wall biosynthesis
MRVLMISDLYPPWQRGGPEIVAYELHRALRARGLDVMLLAEAPMQSSSDGVTLTKHYDNIAVNVVKAFLVKHTRLRPLLKEYDLIHFEVMPGFKNLFLPEVALKAGAKLVATLHGSPMRDLSLKKRGAKRFFSSINCRLALRNISHIDNLVVNSNFMKRIIIDDLNRESTVIPNGVNIGRFSNNTESVFMPPLEGEHRLLYWGRISQEKGVDMIIRSAEHVIRKSPSCHYYIIGDGDKLEETIRLAKDLQLSRNVHFLGFLPHEKISRLASLSDVVIFPFVTKSGVSDNAPLTVLEAMATGRAIVTTRVGGVSELVKDGWNGIFTSPDPIDIAEKTMMLIKDGELRRRMETNAVATAESHSWDRIAEKYIKYYKGIT